MQRKICIESIFYISLIMVMCNFLCFFIFLSGNVIFPIRDEQVKALISIWMALGIAFCMMPYKFIKKKFHVTKEELGIKRVTKSDSFLFMGCFLYIILLLIYKKNLNLLIVVVIQQLGVSIAEEFLSRGIVCYVLKKITNNNFLIAIISGIIFAIGIHSGSQTLDNIVYRIPAGIILGGVYLKTGRLYPSIVIHLIYNLYCIYL